MLTAFKNATGTFNGAFKEEAASFNFTFKLIAVVYLITMLLQNMERISEKIKFACGTLRWVWTLLAFPGLQGHTLGQA